MPTARCAQVRHRQRARVTERRSWSLASSSSPTATGRDVGRLRAQPSRGFARRGLSDGRPCVAQSLHDLVWVYTFEGAVDEEPRDAVDEALDLLKTEGVPPPPTWSPPCTSSSSPTDGAGSDLGHRRPRSPSRRRPCTLAQDAIVVAVIDTGIDEQLRGDGWLNEVGRETTTTTSTSWTCSPASAAALPILDFGAGHGTFVAGIVRQVDPQAKIVVVPRSRHQRPGERGGDRLRHDPGRR